MTTLGQQLRTLRQSAVLTLQDVAQRTGHSVAYLSDIELDRRSPPEETLRRIARALDADFDVLNALSGRISAEIKEYCRRQPAAIGVLVALEEYECTEAEIVAVAEYVAKLACRNGGRR